MVVKHTQMSSSITSDLLQVIRSFDQASAAPQCAASASASCASTTVDSFQDARATVDTIVGTFRCKKIVIGDSSSDAAVTLNPCCAYAAMAHSIASSILRIRAESTSNSARLKALNQFVSTMNLTALSDSTNVEALEGEVQTQLQTNCGTSIAQANVQSSTLSNISVAAGTSMSCKTISFALMKAPGTIACIVGRVADAEVTAGLIVPSIATPTSITPTQWAFITIIAALFLFILVALVRITFSDDAPPRRIPNTDFINAVRNDLGI